MSFTRPGRQESTVAALATGLPPSSEPAWTDAILDWDDDGLPLTAFPPYCRDCLHAYSECACEVTLP